MAWIEPVISRTANSRTTATDMNRIADNMYELGYLPLKRNYTSSDIVTSAQWLYIIGIVQETDNTITQSTDYENLNKIEVAIKIKHAEQTFIYWALSNGTLTLSNSYVSGTYSDSFLADTNFVVATIPWESRKSSITKVNFASKIAPMNMYRWFRLCSNLTSIEHIENLDTSICDNMSGLFQSTSLTTVDLSHFDIRRLVATSSMFRDCTSLERIYASSNWETDGEYGSGMFYYCNNLVGAISYDSTKTSCRYANYNDGYFTYKAV